MDYSAEGGGKVGEMVVAQVQGEKGIPRVVYAVECMQNLYPQ